MAYIYKGRCKMELGLKYRVIENPNLISQEGMAGIDNYLGSQGLPRVDHTTSKWIETKGKYRGKLPNRLGALFKKEHDIKLTPEQRTVIGNLAKMHMVPDEKYVFDFTDKFDWDSGDFGDRGSCFWGENNLARKVMMEQDVIAIRFYNVLDYGKARAWLYLLDDKVWILFNAYGALTTQAIARIFAKHLTQDTDEQWDYCGLKWLTVSGDDEGLVYINAYPQVIFMEDSIPPENVDLKFPVFHCCNDCGEWMHEDEANSAGRGYICYGCWLEE